MVSRHTLYAIGMVWHLGGLEGVTWIREWYQQWN